MIITILIILAGVVILSSNDYNLSTGAGRLGFAKAYFGWTEKVIKNVYSITSYTVKLDWIPKAG